LAEEVRTAAWLAEWQRESAYSDAAAAEALGLSVPSFRRQRSGRSRVSAQTALLAVYVSVHRPNWLNIAELAIKLAKVNARRR
jgi:hypothetical protein